MTEADETVGASVPNATLVGRTVSAGAGTVTIPGLTLGRRLGAGGMAAVYEALDDGFTPPRRVAVKLMSGELTASEEFRARFAREAATVAAFRHDNIVHIYSSGEVNGVKYIVMEYLPGGSLADVLSRGALSVAQAVKIAAVLADALAYSHARGIVHRDFKPANVLLTGENKAVLSDFGVARSMSPDAGVLTREAVIIGAPRYMAPEQAAGEAVNEKIDIYSLGLTLIEMINGKAPMAGWRVVDSDLQKMLPGAPAELVSLIKRCLQLQPDQRPTALQCRDTLARLSAALNPQDTPKVSRTPLLAAIVIGIVLIGAASVVYRSMQPAPEMDAQLTIVRETPSARIFIDGTELPAGPRVPASGRQLLAVAPQFYGVAIDLLEDVDLSSESPELRIALQPTVLPSLEEFMAFGNLMDPEVTPKLSDADVDRVREPTLRLALRWKLLKQNGDTTAADALVRKAGALARIGDSRAAVFPVLIGLRDGNVNRGSIDGPLMAAEERGDPMATVFAAIAQRFDLEDRSPANPEFRAYCNRLQRAGNQGWQSVAEMYLELDECQKQ